MLEKANTDSFDEFVKETALLCADILIELKLVKRPKTFKKKLEVRTKNTGGCYGGLGSKRQPVVTIRKSFEGKTSFEEYSHIRKDKEIGSYSSENPWNVTAAIVAHEVAHAADHWNGDYSSHGSEWRHRYRMLRRELGLIS